MAKQPLGLVTKSKEVLLFPVCQEVAEQISLGAAARQPGTAFCSSGSSGIKVLICCNDGSIHDLNKHGLLAFVLLLKP